MPNGDRSTWTAADWRNIALYGFCVGCFAPREPFDGVGEDGVPFADLRCSNPRHMAGTIERHWDINIGISEEKQDT